VPSSTSNSNPHERAPQRRWVLLGVSSLLLAAILLVATETFWRARGFQPSFTDDEALWSYHRARVTAKPQTLVILGASRSQAGFSQDEFRNRYPQWDLVQLSVSGQSPLAALADLAADPSFRGVVLCSVTAGALQQRNREDQQPYVDYYHQQSPSERREIGLQRWVKGALVSTHPQVSLASVSQRVLRGDGLPRPAVFETAFDRSNRIRYEDLDMEAYRAQRVARVEERRATMEREGPEEWRESVRIVDGWVRTIEARGGKVLFIRYPTTGDHWALDERDFPRANYWDVFATTCAGIQLHFQDVLALRGFECPDTSHLDTRDVPRFTAALVTAMEDRGLLW